MAKFLTHFFFGEQGEQEVLAKKCPEVSRKKYRVIPLNEDLFEAYREETIQAIPAHIRKRKEKTNERIVNKYGANIPHEISIDTLQTDFPGKIFDFNWPINQRNSACFKNLMRYELRMVHPNEDLRVVWQKYNEFKAANIEVEDQQLDFLVQGGDQPQEKEQEQEQEENQEEEKMHENEETFPSPLLLCYGCEAKQKSIEEWEEVCGKQKEMIEHLQKQLNPTLLRETEKQNRPPPPPAEVRERPAKKKTGPPARTIQCLLRKWKKLMEKYECSILEARELLLRSEKPEYVGYVEKYYICELTAAEDAVQVDLEN